jgi:hypothetical protein
VEEGLHVDGRHHGCHCRDLQPAQAYARR